MKIQLRNIELRSLEQFKNKNFDESYKTCTRCGQSKYPFRYGRCFLCQKQVSDIEYLKQYEKILSDRGIVKMGIKEVFQGLDEIEVSD